MRLGQSGLLVLRPGAIGDTLLTLPALAALRARFPGDRLTLVGNRAAAPLVQLAGLTDQWIDFDAAAVASLFVPKPPERFSVLVNVGGDARRAPLRTAVAWCRDQDGVLKANLERLGAKGVLVAPSRPPVAAN